MLRDFSARIRRAAIGLAVAVAVGVVPLAACGVKGALKLPPPPAAAPGAPSSEAPEASSAAPPAASGTTPERKQ